MNKKTKRIIVIAAAAVLLIAAAVIIFIVVKAGSAGYRSISIAEIFGKVITQNGGKTYEAYKNMRLADGYELTTDPGSYTRMVLDDDKYVKLEQESHAIFEALGDSKKHLTTIRLEKGALTTEITKPLTETESYVVNTPNAVLAVRGTMFRVEVKQDQNGDFYCDVYTYGGIVEAHRVMPDGTHVDEHVEIRAGYKATIKMDEVITVYLEEKIDEATDNVDPINVPDIIDSTLVDIYNSSYHGHDMFITTSELWDEVLRRGIDLSEYKSAYDGKDIPKLGYDETSSAGSAGNNSENSIEKTDSVVSSYGISDNSSDSSETTSNNASESENPGSSAIIPPNSSDDNNNHIPDTSSAQDSGSSPDTSVSKPENSSESVSSAPESTSVPESSSGSPESSSTSNSSETPIVPPSPAHTHTLATTTTEPTCTQSGFKIVKCEVCGETVSEETLPPRGHISVTETVIPATCTDEGEEIDRCSVCNGQLGRRTIPALGHTEVTSTVSATCTESGKTIVKCKVCNELLKETVIPAKGHSFGEYKSNNDATCRKDGTKTAVCEVCGESDTITDEGSMLPHMPETVTVPSTCTEDGKTTVTCSVCGEIINETVIDALGHDYEDKITKPASCTEDGAKVEVCTRCDEERPGSLTVIEKLPHTEITEEEDGIRTVKCRVCGEIITQTDLATGITYPIEISGIFFAPVPQSIMDSDVNNDGKLSLDECRAVTELSFGEGETESGTGALEQLVIFPDLENINITVMITDGNLSIGAIDGLIVSNISNVIGGTYPSDVPGLIKDIIAGTEIGCDFTMSDERTIPVRFVPAEGSTFAPETPEGVEINAENFPDEVFRQYVSENFDDGDGVLTQEECNAVIKIDVAKEVTKSSIYSLVGIEYFKELQTLNIGHYDNIYTITHITSLDVRNNTALIDLDCSGTQVTSLDISNNTALINLNCSRTKITSLDVRNNTALITLNCYDTQITSLDVSKNMMLTYLECANTQITSLDVSKNTALEKLYCRKTQIPYVDIINNTNIPMYNSFSANDCNHPIHVEDGVFDLKSIDGFDISRIVGTVEGMDENGVISGITEGTSISYTYDCKGTGESAYQAEFTLVPDENSTFAPETPEGVAIDETNFPDEKFREYVSTNFDTDKNGYLSQEECDAVTKIDVSGSEEADGGVTELSGAGYFPNLEELDCSYNNDISSISPILRGWGRSSLKRLSCNHTQIVFESLSWLDDLVYLDCSDTPTTKLPIMAKLQFLNCNNTNIKSLDKSEYKELTELYCSGTMLTKLDCWGTKLVKLDVSNNTALTELKCNNTQITSLDISNNTALTSLDCSHTQITSLDVSENTALVDLRCYDTKITSLNISNNTMLEVLDCSYTQITSLDVSNNTALTYLDCAYTQITSMDLSNNNEITTFGCECSINVHVENGEIDVSGFKKTGFNPNKVSGFSGIKGIDKDSGNFFGIVSGTSQIVYVYDCGQEKQGLFWLIPDESSTFDSADSVAALSDNTNDTTLPPNAPDNTGGAPNEDTALPPEDIDGLRFLPLGILALMRDRKRKTAFRVKRKAETY